MRTRTLFGIAAILGLFALVGPAQAGVDCSASSVLAEPAECAAAAPAPARAMAPAVKSPSAPTDLAFAHDIRNTDNVVTHVLNDFPGQTANGTNTQNIFAYALDPMGVTLYGLDNSTQTLGTMALDGTFTAIGTSTPCTGCTWTGMAFDPRSPGGTLYGSAVDGAQACLFTIDTATGAATQVGCQTTTPLLIDIAMNCDGTMYGHDIGDDNIYTIDTATGAATVVGPTGVNSNFAQGLSFDRDDGTLYAYTYQGGGANTYGTIDLGTGALTPLATSNPLGEFEGETLTICPGVAGAICNTGLALPIPDNNPTGVSDTISIAAPPLNDIVTDMDLILQVTHTFVGDIAASLTHVDTATTTVPYDRPGVPATTFGCGSDNIDVTLNDEGVDGDLETTCLPGPPGIAGDLVPGDPPNTSLFAAYDGEPIAGDWTLTVSDNAGADTGTLDAWCLVPTLDTMPFLDGFESGDTSMWTVVVP